MPPFQPNATVPVPAPTAPSSTGPALAPRDRARDVVARHVKAANVVQVAVVGFADQRVDRADLLVARLRERPARPSRPAPPPTDSVLVSTIGDLDRAELLHLRRAGELSERVADEHGARHLLAEQIPAVRKHRRDPGADAVALTTVVWPTSTPATSVIALSGPGSIAPGAMSRSRARGRDWAPLVMVRVATGGIGRHEACGAYNTPVTVYLACTVRGDRGAVAVLRTVADRLEYAGHHVLTRHLLDDNVDAAESALTEREVFARDMTWLTAADAVIAEASGSSYGVGFEVGYVLGRSDVTNERVLLLYNDARRSAVLAADRRHRSPALHGALLSPRRGPCCP